MSNPRLRHGDDALADAARIHQLARQNKKRHRQQRKAVDPSDQVLRQQLGVPKVEHPGHARAGQHQRQTHVHADAHERQHAERKNDESQAFVAHC